jgi:hypothetical protein
MDFGLDKLIEMFEERFGRTASTALLFIIGLAAFSAGLKMVYNNIVVPILDISKAFMRDEEWVVLLRGDIFSAVFTALLSVVIYISISWFINKKINRMLEDARQEALRLKEELNLMRERAKLINKNTP